MILLFIVRCLLATSTNASVRHLADVARICVNYPFQKKYAAPGRFISGEKRGALPTARQYAIANANSYQ
jgi:hypothetical protein